MGIGVLVLGVLLLAELVFTDLFSLRGLLTSR